MGKVVMDGSVSVDGFVADENDRPGPLFDWLSGGLMPGRGHKVACTCQDAGHPSREASMSGWLVVAGYLMFSLAYIYFFPYRWLREAEARLAETRRQLALARLSDDAWLVSHDAVLELLDPTIRHHFYSSDTRASTTPVKPEVAPGNGRGAEGLPRS